MEPTRILSGITAAIATCVVVDAVGVGAPGLAIVALPFVVALLMLRRSPRAGAVIAAVGCLLVAVTAAAYLTGDGGLQSGFDALYVYVAAPLAVIGLVAVVGVFRARHAVRG